MMNCIWCSDFPMSMWCQFDFSDSTNIYLATCHIIHFKSVCYLSWSAGILPSMMSLGVLGRESWASTSAWVEVSWNTKQKILQESNSCCLGLAPPGAFDLPGAPFLFPSCPWLAWHTGKTGEELRRGTSGADDWKDGHWDKTTFIRQNSKLMLLYTAMN